MVRWSSNQPMKKASLLVLSSVAAAVLVLSSQGVSQAAPNDDPPSIAGFGIYNGGTTKNVPALKSFALEVPVRVTGASPRTGKLNVKRNGSTILNAPFTIGGGETKAIPLVDSVGTEKACQPAHYNLELIGSDFDVKKTATVTPSCTFSSTWVNPWTAAAPDVVAASKKNHVWFSDADGNFIMPGPGQGYWGHIMPKMEHACAASGAFKVRVTNDAGHPVSGLTLTVSLNGKVLGTSPPFTLATGEAAWHTATFKFEGEAGSYVVGLVAPPSRAQSVVASSGYHVDVAHACSITTSLDP